MAPRSPNGNENEVSRQQEKSPLFQGGRGKEQLRGEAARRREELEVGCSGLNTGRGRRIQ